MSFTLIEPARTRFRRVRDASTAPKRRFEELDVSEVETPLPQIITDMIPSPTETVSSPISPMRRTVKRARPTYTTTTARTTPIDVSELTPATIQRLRYVCSSPNPLPSQVVEAATNIGIDPKSSRDSLCATVRQVYPRILPPAQTLYQQYQIMYMVPEQYKDPITNTIMYTPVLTSSGTHYDWGSLAHYTQDNYLDVKTGQELLPFAYFNKEKQDQIIQFLSTRGITPDRPLVPPNNTVLILEEPQRRYNAGIIKAFAI
jgi:hypothetical protein